MNIAFRVVGSCCLLGVTLFCLLGQAQQAGRDLMPSLPNAPAQSLLALLNIEEVQREIELLDEQKTKISAIRDRVVSEMTRGMARPNAGVKKKVNATEARQEEEKRLRDQTLQIQELADRLLKEVLLPHQYKRLNQINFQLQMEIPDYLVPTLTSDKLRQALGISEAEWARIKQQTPKIQNEMFAKIQKAKAEAREQWLGLNAK